MNLKKGLLTPGVKESMDRHRTMNEWTEDILNLNEEDPIGYMFEVDLEYPKNLHKDETHDNFPLAPESFKIEKYLLSPIKKTWVISLVSSMDPRSFVSLSEIKQTTYAMQGISSFT